jgi:hypothetical protein
LLLWCIISGGTWGIEGIDIFTCPFLIKKQKITLFEQSGQTFSVCFAPLEQESFDYYVLKMFGSSGTNF